MRSISKKDGAVIRTFDEGSVTQNEALSCHVICQELRIIWCLTSDFVFLCAAFEPSEKLQSGSGGSSLFEPFGHFWQSSKNRIQFDKSLLQIK